MNRHYMDENNQETHRFLENLQSFRLSGVIKDHTLVRAENEELWVTALSVIGKMKTPPPITRAPVESSAISAVAGRVRATNKQGAVENSSSIRGQCDVAAARNKQCGTISGYF